MLRPSQAGMFLGAALGYAVIVKGFAEMLVVALLAALGWVIGWVATRVQAGDIDLDALAPRRRGDAGRPGRPLT